MSSWCRPINYPVNVKMKWKKCRHISSYPHYSIDVGHIEARIEENTKQHQRTSTGSSIRGQPREAEFRCRNTNDVTHSKKPFATSMTPLPLMTNFCCAMVVARIIPYTRIQLSYCWWRKEAVNNNNIISSRKAADAADHRTNEKEQENDEKEESLVI